MSLIGMSKFAPTQQAFLVSQIKSPLSFSDVPNQESVLFFKTLSMYQSLNIKELKFSISNYFEINVSLMKVRLEF